MVPGTSIEVMGGLDEDVRPVSVIGPPAFTLERIWESLAALPRYTDLIYTLTAHRIAVRYKQSILGPLWAIVQPLAMMMAFVAVFSLIGRPPTGGQPFPLFVYAALLPWSALASALGSGSTSLVTHAALVTRVYFPREILPLSYVAAAVFDLAIGATVLAALLVFYDVQVTAALLWTVPMIALLAAVAVTVSLVLCAVHVRFRDVGVAMPLLLQVWMFASPVIYPLEAVPPAWQWLYTLNPMAGIIDGFRGADLEGSAPNPAAVWPAVAVVVVGLPIAYLWFKRVEATMADFV